MDVEKLKKISWTERLTYETVVRRVRKEWLFDDSKVHAEYAVITYNAK